MPSFTTLFTLSLAAFAAAFPSPLPSNLEARRDPLKGHIAVYTNNADRPGIKVGYLDAAGRWTAASSGAVYTLASEFPFDASTPNGNCGWHDNTEPLNGDMIPQWGNTYAWRCKADLKPGIYPDGVAISRYPDASTTPILFEWIIGSGVAWVFYAKTATNPTGSTAVDIFGGNPTAGVQDRTRLFLVWEAA